MSLKSRLTAQCTISREEYTTSDVGQDKRSFVDPVRVNCKLDHRSGIREDLQLGRVVVEKRLVLYLAPDATITPDHKVTQNAVDYKVNHVRPFFDGRGALHHYECDLEELK